MLCGYTVQRENAKEIALLELTCFFTYFNLEQTRSKFIWNDFQFYFHPTTSITWDALNRSRILELDFDCVQYRIKGYDAKF